MATEHGAIDEGARALTPEGPIDGRGGRIAFGASLIPLRYWMVALAVIAIMAAVLFWLGRTPICTCGTIKLWVGAVNGPDNSQHLADWYTPSHIIHGFLFYLLGWMALRRSSPGERLILAVMIESAWEIIENSPMIIERYREATIAFGYNGDSVINSVTDVLWMLLGFGLARRLPLWVSAVVVLVLELIALHAIRDNLTLNVWMLLSPSEAIRAWQAGG